MHKKSDVVPAVGQRWRDRDTRCRYRKVVITAVTDTHVHYKFVANHKSKRERFVRAFEFDGWEIAPPSETP